MAFHRFVSDVCRGLLLSLAGTAPCLAAEPAPTAKEEVRNIMDRYPGYGVLSDGFGGVGLNDTAAQKHTARTSECAELEALPPSRMCKGLLGGLDNAVLPELFADLRKP
jgi:hypothetical protein